MDDSTVDFDRFIDQAWADHAGDPAAVAARLQTQGLGLATHESRLVPLARLAQHVFGEHLARWEDGRRLLRELAALPHCSGGGAAAQALRRFSASLSLAEGDTGARAALGVADGIHVDALAAASLAGRDTPRALQLFESALAQADAAALPATDPSTRALAVTANNLAAALEELPRHSAGERRLMILAAQAARRYWALAGGWLETERAELRLALSWLKAGDAAQARTHAQQCLAIVAEHGDPALERFFACDALARIARAAGDSPGREKALAQAEAAFAELTDDERGWCGAALDGLRAG